MNKFLVSFVLASVVSVARAGITVDGATVYVQNCDNVDFNVIKNTPGNTYNIANSGVVINDLADWQNWGAANVTFGPNVSLYIKNLDDSYNGEQLRHVVSTDVINIVQKDNYNLYKITRYSPPFSNAVFLKLVRETDYEKVFGANDARGSFIENIRASHPDDKMLPALDMATNQSQIESAMNSSYHFNPIILMNPIKTLNRIRTIEMFGDESDFAVGANGDFIWSDKTTSYGGHAFIGNKFNNLYFKFTLNFNSFSYGDDFNDFSGMFYGMDVRAKYYLDELWFDGVLGLGQTSFNAENVYDNGDIKHNPKGASEYGRISVGYDMKIEDVTVAPFVGALFQKNEVVGFDDTQTNLHAGLMAKYGFAIDGIKYVYGAKLGIDDKTNLNAGANIGFVSVVDGAGANLNFDVFQEDIATSYKLSVNAKINF